MVGPVFPSAAVQRIFEAGALGFTAPDGGVFDYHVRGSEEGKAEEQSDEVYSELHLGGVFLGIFGLGN